VRRCFLAVDAGNSKTDALLVDDACTLLGWGRGGTGDIASHRGEEAAFTEVESAVRTALTALPDDGRLEHAAFRLAGIDWPEDEVDWLDAVQRRWRLPGTVTFLNDGFAPIRLHALDGVGLAVTAGTHSAFAGRGPHGVEFGMNEWTMHETGAHGLGKAAFHAVALAVLDMAPPTRLVDTVPAHFGYTDVADVVHDARSRERPITEATFSQLAPLVTSAAAEGDEVASRIVAAQAELFGRYTATVARRAGFAASDPVRVALNGSVARASTLFAAAVTEQILQRLPAAIVRIERVPPVAGAALDALIEGGVHVEQADADRLIEAIATADARLASGVPQR
jgi:N-acetylglucosamine kinase-like BadF-type ATPase